MSDQNIVITVRLSDVDEADQPDPICLPADELTTWRHFEALLQSMYRDPPSAIRVCYLDEESDWVEVSSDAELSDAIKVAQRTDEILQLQVKRGDFPQNVYFESTLSESPASIPVESDYPHVTPLHTTYYTEGDWDKLRYCPIPPDPRYPTVYCNIPDETLQHLAHSFPLTYPHPNQSSATGPSQNSIEPNENVILLDANGRTTYLNGRPDSSGPEEVKRLKDKVSKEKRKRLQASLPSQEMFKQASGYSSEDKVKFMKTMVTGQPSKEETKIEKQEMQLDARAKISYTEERENNPELLIEPLSSNHVHSQTVADPPAPTLAVQDPFEVVCRDQPSRDLEQIQLNLQPGNILKPEKPRDSSSPPKENESVVVVDEVPTIPITVKTRPSAASMLPIPLLYTLQMMDGAQSGANAVAIEIPEGDNHGAAQKEEDVTASGGASSTSASAETGEITSNRTCHDGAAVGDKVKVRSTNQHVNGQATFQPSSVVSGTKTASKKSKKSNDSISSKTTLKGTEKSKSKKEEKEHTKESKEICCAQNVTNEKGSDSKTEADVESGEKIVKRKRNKTPKMHTKDIVKFMTKMQTELHSGIVKDVGKQTDKLLKQTFSRSISYESSLSHNLNADETFEVVHRGIYCDSCNVTIRGIRFKCGNCPDFDFCEKCEASQHSHDPSHVFLKLHRPAPQAGKVDAENVPLLREIIYKKSYDSVSNESGKVKIEHLEDVPILSISEVTTPGRKQSPPSTPSESHKKTDVSNWVWDSTFDTDKHLYPIEGDGSFSGSSTNNQQSLGDSEMKRLYALLSIEAEAAKRANSNGEDLIVEIPKLTSVPEMAESVHSLSTLPTTNSRVDIEEEASHLSLPIATTPAQTSPLVEVLVSQESLDTFENTDDRPEAEGCDDPKMDSNSDDEECNSQASSVELLEAEEYEEAFEEVEARGGDDDDEEEAADHHSDSDTSDDFCVLDPPSRSDVEENEQESVTIYKAGENVHHTPDVPSMEMVHHVRAEGEAVSLASNAVIADQIKSQEKLAAEKEIPVAEEVIEAIQVLEPESAISATESQVVQGNDDVDNGKLVEVSGGSFEVKEEEKEVQDKVSEMNFTEDDVLMQLSGEERCRFLEMVKCLTERAEDLEMELKMRKESEAQARMREEAEAKYQMILLEKEREAERENEKLEELQRKKLREERVKIQQRLVEQGREDLRKLKQLSTGVSVGEGAKKKSKALSLSTKPPTLMQMALNTQDRNGRVSRPGTAHAVKQEAVVTSPSAPSSGQTNASTAVQVDNIIYVQSEKKDADCQTTGRGVSGAEAAAQASQMIHSVASGVSKAAGAAFHTAKDVFYSLQAKQVEKKTYEGVVYSKTTPLSSKASSTDATNTTSAKPGQGPQETPEQTTATWTPPSSVWTPPSDTFIPPKSEWNPPQSDWKPPNVNWIPPKSEWTSPKSEWTPPQGYYQPPPLASDVTSASAATTTHATALAAPTPMSDKTPTSHQELKKQRSNDASCTNNDEEQSNRVRSSSSSSVSAVPLPPLPPIQITDPILRREVQGMQLLIEMGFANREQNRRLLQEHEGDVEKVVQSLLQEEREEHWAWGQRH